MTTTTPSPQEMSVLLVRVETLERDLKKLGEQLQTYVPARENDIRLQSIQDSVKRTESDVSKIKDQLSDLYTKLTNQDQASQVRDNSRRAAQDRLQIQYLTGIIAFFFSVLAGLLVAFLTHLIH